MEPLHVSITREPFSPFCTLTLPDGTTEDYEAQEATDWLILRGASSIQVDEVLTEVWNFGAANLVIAKPRKIVEPEDRTRPNLHSSTAVIGDALL